MTSAEAIYDPEKIRSDYERSLAVFEQIIDSASARSWDRPSKCDEWTLADVVGHVTWGQRFISGLATGRPFENRDGAPGAPHPRVMVGDDPVHAFRQARDEAFDTLTPAALRKVVEIGPAFGTAPLARFAVALSVVDVLAHAWDLGAAAGLPVHLPDDLVAAGGAAARAINITRDTPGGIKRALEPPAGADAQTRFLAFLGRRDW